MRIESIGINEKMKTIHGISILCPSTMPKANANVILKKGIF
jgi:hypothetical protein